MKENISDTLFFSMTWKFLNIYLTGLQRKSQKTVKSYSDALTIFRKYITDNLHIRMDHFLFNDLTYDFMLDYRDYLESKKYKPRTINHRLTAVNVYMRYAASQKTDLSEIYLRISKVPLVKVPVRHGKVIEDKDAIKTLFESPDLSDKGIRDQLILVLLYDAALRADELLSLKLSDIILTCDTPYIRVIGKGDKERFVGISDKTVSLIRQYIGIFHSKSNPDTPFIYTTIRGQKGKMSERNLERIVKKYGNIAKTKTNDMPDNVHPHMLRRTRATGWYRDKVPIETIAVILGHSNTSTTRKSYAFPSVEQLRSEMEKGTEVEPNTTQEKKDQPLWTNDDDFAKLCGIR